MLEPHPQDVMVAYLVGTRVNSPIDYDEKLTRMLRTIDVTISHNDHEVTNQQRRSGADFQYCNDIHESLLSVSAA